MENLSLLCERFPEIGFHLNYTPFSPFELFTNQEGKINARRETDLHAHSIEQEISAWKESLDLEGIDILYVYGLGLGYHYEALQKWLHEKQERILIFIEEEIAVFHAFIQRKEAKALLQDSKVHLCLLSDKNKLEEMAISFPSDRIAFTALASSDKRKSSRIKLSLMRNSAFMHAIMSEALFPHKLFENVLPNFKRMHEAFFANHMKGCFKDIPAVICGAGPSLAHSIETLKKLENRALIIAGGSSIAALNNYGVLPHLGMAFDPNHEEYLRLKAASSFQVPMIYGNRVRQDIFATANSPLGYMCSDTGGLCETYLEKELGIEEEPIGPELGREAFSVTTMGVAFAYALGCNPIILTGVDLAYTGMQRYAGGVVEDAKVGLAHLQKDKRVLEQLVKKKDRNGKTIYTAIKWVMESSCIGSFAKEHPDRTFLNATDGGIGFPHIPYKTLRQIAEESCQKSYDLRGKIHAISQNLAFSFSSQKVEEIGEKLYMSLGRVKSICQEMIDELKGADGKTLPTGKMVLLEMDLKEEIAFSNLLAPVVPALERMLSRCFTSLIEQEKMKWEQFNEIVQSCLASFERSFISSSRNR